ncbi:hypothetical protein EON83_15560 [bacterium]|nr:MAG: hypothetical protein EON83_15560 [bacterium]
MAQFRLLLAGALFLSAGCIPTNKAATPLPTTKPSPALLSPDLKELRRYITVPRNPVAVIWEYKQIGDGIMGPSDSQILAVIQYPPADANAIEQTLRKSGTPSKGEVALQSWFPRDLYKKSVRTSGRGMVLHGTKFDATPFARQSLQNGFALRIPNTPYFVVSLFTT